MVAVSTGVSLFDLFLIIVFIKISFSGFTLQLIKDSILS